MNSDLSQFILPHL